VNMKNEGSVIVLALGAALAACGCDHGKGQGEEVDEYIEPCGAGVSFASDESYISLRNAEDAGYVTVDDERGVVLLEPAGTVSASVPPKFLLKVGLMAHSGAQVPGCPRARGTVRGRAVLAALRSVFVFERQAEAHCPAVNGDNYLLRLTDAGSKAPVYTAMLSVLSFTPNADAWRRALAGRSGGKLNARILRATFSGGNIPEGLFVSSRAITLDVTL